MERHREMDLACFATGCTLTRRPAMRTAALLLILIILPISLRAQSPPREHIRLAEVRQLFTEERWEEIILIAEAETARSAELNYYYGTALARVERWEDAKRAFENGLKQEPGDKRFSLELAGVAFKQRDYREAAGHLRDALKLDPADRYANDFLASVYFLQGNLEAAVKYWNRVSKPQVEEVRFDPTPKVDPILLDHFVAFAPAALLRLPELQTTEARMSGLNIFLNHRLFLEARSDGKFDAVFRGLEQPGWGNKWQGLLSLLRGLPFQTVHPEFFNIRGRAINSVSLIRWDREKRRFRTNLSGPFSRYPKRQYELALDLRDENWNLLDVSTGQTQGALKLRKQAFTAGLTSFVNGRWNWSTAAELSHRRLLDVTAAPVMATSLDAQGFQLKHVAGVNYDAVRIPERRFTVRTGASTELGRIWSQPSHAFFKLGASIGTQWFPQATGDDWETQGRIRVGKTFGEVPFDELSILGVERDNDLWLRAHIGTHDGRKGSAPLGRNYFLSNWELDKRVFADGLISVKLGPFIDGGKITDSSSGLGSRRWLWDIGVQTKIRVLGVGVAISFGKDLRSGKNAVYLTMLR